MVTPSQFFSPTLSQTTFPDSELNAIMPEFGCPPTITIRRFPSRTGVLPTPKKAGGTFQVPVSRCQTSLPLRSRQSSLPSAPKVKQRLDVSSGVHRGPLLYPYGSMNLLG